jgi:hypothetical protein
VTLDPSGPPGAGAARRTPKQKRSVPRDFVLTFVAVTVGLWGLLLLVPLRESLWPWTDVSMPHAVMHVVNESDVVVRAGWRWADSDDWHGVRPAGRDSDGVNVHSSDYELIRALLPRMVLADPEALPGFTKGIVLRVDSAVLGSVEHEVTVRLHDHVQLRISADHRLFFSAGGESWIGYPVLGPETELSVR